MSEQQLKNKDMKDFFKTPIPYLAIIWFIMVSGYLIYLVNDGLKGDITTTNELTKLCEQAYFEGQRDALENNIVNDNIGINICDIKFPFFKKVSPILFANEIVGMSAKEASEATKKIYPKENINHN